VGKKMSRKGAKAQRGLFSGILCLGEMSVTQRRKGIFSLRLCVFASKK
jgi:hypothetical protein